MTDFIKAVIDMPLEEAERAIDNITRDTRIFTGHCGEEAYLAYYGRHCTAVGEMELGILNRQIRSIQTEGHFGDIKENENFRRFNYRSTEKVNKESLLKIKCQ